MGLWRRDGPPNLGQESKPYNNQQKKENLENCRLCCPANHRIKLKECEKKDKYLDLAKELKKMWNMKVTWQLSGDYPNIYIIENV